jgi:RNA recognition motif-containing protein
MSIYIGNIPYTMGEEDLTKLFEEFGTVKSAKIILDKIKNRSKGYGFVELVEANNEDNAVSALNGKEIGGRNVKVSKAKTKKDQES